jgi:dienelactone hydrolase
MGNTIMEMVQAYMDTKKGASLEDLAEISIKSALNRPVDISFLIDNILTGNTWVPQGSVDAEKIGITGHSFGGWTTVVATTRDNRIRAALPLAPGGGDSSEKKDDSEEREGELLRVIREFWDREVGILYLAAENDHLVPLKAVIDLYSRTPRPKQMVVLNNADHFHFNDAIEQVHEYFRTQSITMGGNNPETIALADSMQPASELHPSKGAYEYIRGLGLAHMDFYLKGKKAAKDFLASDLKSLLAEREIDVSIY